MPRLRLLPEAVEAKTPEDCASILRYLERRAEDGGAVFGIDTETTGLDKMRDRVLFWSMATDEDRYCFPIGMLTFFDPLFDNKDITWALANAKYDMHLLKNMGTELTGPKDDIIVMDAMVDDTRAHGLKDQADYAYDARWGDFKELFLDPYFVGNVLGFDKKDYAEFKKMGVGDKLLRVYGQSPQTVVDYASCDAYFTLMRHRDLSNALASEELPTQMVAGMSTLLDYYTIIEQPMTQCLWDMERKGILIDQDYIKKLDIPMREGIKGLESELHRIAGKTFNPKSPDQLKWILYDAEGGFGMKPIRYTKGGKSVPKPSTDEKTLDILMQKHAGTVASQFIKKLLEHRSLVKLHGTYVKGIMKYIGPDNRLHTKYNQAGARTARLSSSEPNVQNIPRPDPMSDPYMLRGAFIASPGKDLIDRDYPQIEFRVAAVNANDERMMTAVRNGWDIHNANTANMYGIPYEDVALAKSKKKDELTKEDKAILRKRQESKTVGLGTLFGEGARKMAAQLNISVDAAYSLKNLFFEKYPGIEQNIYEMHDFAHEYGFTYTMLGRKRRLHKINNSFSNFIVAQEERQAYNTSVQGSAAELIKLAMLQIHFDKDLRSLGNDLLLTVHDELLSEAPKGVSKDVGLRMEELMQHPLHWGPIQLEYPVPIQPDGDNGYRWSELH